MTKPVLHFLAVVCAALALGGCSLGWFEAAPAPREADRGRASEPARVAAPARPASPDGNRRSGSRRTDKAPAGAVAPAWDQTERTRNTSLVLPKLSEIERMCLASGAVRKSAFVEPKPGITGKWSQCGARRTFDVRAADHGRVKLSPAAKVRCPMVPAIDRWVREVVAPAAIRELGSPVTSLRVLASYACRTRNSRRGARVSEHGRANAVDVAAFTLADGRVVTVKRGWRGRLDESRFLRRVHLGGCKIFTTVLGPDSDKYHHNHFHLDLARHGRKGTYRVCR